MEQELIEMLQNFVEEEMKDLSPEFCNIIEENYWDLF